MAGARASSAASRLESARSSSWSIGVTFDRRRCPIPAVRPVQHRRRRDPCRPRRCGRESYRRGLYDRPEGDPMAISERAGRPAEPATARRPRPARGGPTTTSGRTRPTPPSGSRSGRPATAARRSTAPSTRRTSWRRPRRSAATARARAPTGRCSSGATRTRCPSRRSRRPSRSSSPTAWTSGSTTPTATRRRRSSRTRSWSTTGAGRGPPGGRHRRHAVAQPARGRRLQVQPAQRRAGGHGRHGLDPGRGEPPARGRAGRRRAQVPLERGARGRDRARLPGRLRRRPRVGHRHGRDPGVRAAARGGPAGRRERRLLAGHRRTLRPGPDGHQHRRSTRSSRS